MSLIVKNTTNGDIFISDVGTKLLANTSTTIHPTQYMLWTASTQITSYINSGDVIINDGESDLSSALAIKYLKFREALGIPFRSEPERSNGFVSKNIQEAVEEIKDTAIGAGGNWFFFNDAGTEDKWLQITEHHSQPSGPFNSAAAVADDNKDIIPLIIPQPCKIYSLSFVNKKDGAETDIQIYKNGSLLFTWEIRNSRWRVKNTGLSSLTFNPGDKISIFAKKVVGAIEKPDDLNLFLYYKVTSTSTTDYGDSDFVTGN